MFKAFQEFFFGPPPGDELHPMLPHRYWHEGGGAPHPWVQYEFSIRFGGGDRSPEFFYCLPAYKHRGSVVRVGGGGLITEQERVTRILESVQQYVIRNYAEQTRAAILSWQRRAAEAGLTLPTRTNPVPAPPSFGEFVPMVAVWDQDTVTQPEAVSFQAYFSWPKDGSIPPIEFRCYLALGGTEAVVAVNYGNTGREPEAERVRILTAVRTFALVSYNIPIREAMLRYWAAHELDKFVAQFRTTVEADAKRVVAEIEAGRSAKLQDWLNKVKPAPDVLAALGANRWPGPAERKLLESMNAKVQRAVAEADGKARQAEADARRAVEHAALEVQWAQERADAAALEAAKAAQKERLKSTIFLASDAGARGGITFGAYVEDVGDLIIPVGKIQHMLVGGVPGSGKTVFLHSLIVQFLRSAEVDQVILIDLKGTEFVAYQDHPKARVFNEIDTVVTALDGVLELLEARKAELIAQKRRTWPGPRVFVVIDEHAMINAYIAEAKAGGQKALAVRLANSFRQIVLTARSFGVTLICALQKPTSDAIDSNIKANMGFRCCFTLKTRQAIDAVLDYTDELPIDPRNLRTGRFLLDDGRGDCVRLQAHVPPELDLSGGW